MYSTRLYVYTSASGPNGHPRKEKGACRTSRRTIKSARCPARACPARGKLNGEVAGHADILATILARMSATMSVSVSVPLNLTARPIFANFLCMLPVDMTVSRLSSDGIAINMLRSSGFVADVMFSYNGAHGHDFACRSSVRDQFQSSCSIHMGC